MIRSIAMLERALKRARTGDSEPVKALKRLAGIAAAVNKQPRPGGGQFLPDKLY